MLWLEPPLPPPPSPPPLSSPPPRLPPPSPPPGLCEGRREEEGALLQHRPPPLRLQQGHRRSSRRREARAGLLKIAPALPQTIKPPPSFPSAIAAAHPAPRPSTCPGLRAAPADAHVLRLGWRREALSGGARRRAPSLSLARHCAWMCVARRPRLRVKKTGIARVGQRAWQSSSNRRARTPQPCRRTRAVAIDLHAPALTLRPARAQVSATG